MLVPPTTQAPGDFEEAGFEEEVVWDGLTLPMAIEFAPDGRIFVAEKTGVIRVFSALDDPTPSVYADLRTNVHNYWDRGLLGMALDPNFVSNGRIYVSYAYNAAIGEAAPRWVGMNATNDPCPNPPGGTADGCVISGRLSVLTDGANEQVLINDWCQQYPSHSMGDIVFDAEGALIVTSGDGANFNAADWGQWGGTLPNTTSPVTPQNPCGDPFDDDAPNEGQATGEGGGLRSQDIRTAGDPLGLSGTVLRLNPMNGDALSDNPGSGTLTSNAKKIVAYGLRNPFRSTIHPVTGDLWLGDVGWGTWEEVNRLNPDGTSVPNFGWPCREGSSFEPAGWDETNLCTSMPAPTAPHFAYLHGGAVGGECTQETSSISGLAFYPGGAYPDGYDNALFFIDYSRQCIWVMPVGAGGVPDAGAVAFFGELAEPVQLKVGPGGDLFYADFGTFADSVPGGSIRRIRFQADNASPTADIVASPTSGDPPLAVGFDASGSTDPDDNPLTYAWDFGDNDDQFNDSFDAAPSHTYNEPGSHVARVRVDDGHGGTDTHSVTISVDNAAPNGTITSPTASFTWSVGQTVGFSGTASDPDQGTLPASVFEWELLMHHCPDICHTHQIETWSDVRNGSFTAPDHEYPSHLELRLTVTDEHGVDEVSSALIQPKTVTLQMRSNPSGLRLSAAGRTATAPFNVTVIRNSRVVLGVPSGQTFDGFDYDWVSWSHGGSKTQTITASASATYTARFDGGYDDVPPGAKFAADISWLTNEGITVGCDTSPPLYCPNGLVTRGQMATFLVRALDLPATSTDYFTDDETNKHEARINSLRAAGITFGCTATRFCPDGLVTRGQMASFLVRALDLPGTSTDWFTDDETNKHEARINSLRTAAITYGCGPTTFCPDGIVTRGQMAAFLHRGMGDEPSN